MEHRSRRLRTGLLLGTAFVAGVAIGPASGLISRHLGFGFGLAAFAAQDSGRFRSRAELDELYGYLSPDDKTVVYCRIGERSSHTWFVLTHLLGLPGVRNYDGSWTEWGNAVRVPVAVGEEPGEAP